MKRALEWQNILQDGETILWQERPDQRVVFRRFHLFPLVMGLILCGFGLIWGYQMTQESGYFWLIGLMIFNIGIFTAVAPPFVPPFRRRHTWYTLTNKRAFIATDFPLFGKGLKSYDITARSPLSLQGNDPKSVIFTSRRYKTKAGMRTHYFGFDRIKDADKVYQLMLDMVKQQKNT